jgi:dUTP pyrophosphatase
MFIKYLPNYDRTWGDLAYATEGSAGFDLRACLFDYDKFNLFPGATCIIPCGFAVELPKTLQMEVRPRSGLAAHHGITVLNSPGTIDSDYRGEIFVTLINHGYKPFEIKRGDRIAQAVIMPFIRVSLYPVEELSNTERGEGGLGSTGTH